jgi:hypothetical protein
MLFTAIALLALAGACAVVLFGQRAEAPVQFVPSFAETSATTDAWRSAALDAHSRAQVLRRGIASALEVPDSRAREAYLRDLLADTWRPEGIRINL